MSVQSNIDCVKKIYAAFGSGDVPAILEVMHPDIEWEFGFVAKSREIPWLSPKTGREAVAGFFQALGDHLTFEKFDILGVMGDGPWVVALAHIECVHKGTGKRLVEHCEPHVWRFDDSGRVVAMRHGADTLHHAEAAGLV